MLRNNCNLLLAIATVGIAYVGINCPAMAQADQHDFTCQITSNHSQQLSQQINEIIQRPEQQKAQWGIALQDVETNAIIYQNNAQKFFIPASNVKLFTTAAALVELGSEYQFKTDIYAVGTAPNIETLILVGKGDPTLKSEQLDIIIEALKQQQITAIQDVVLLDNYFAESPINPTWEWSDLTSYYGTPVNSFILDENTFTVQLLPTIVGQKTSLTSNNPIALNQWQIDNQLLTAPQGTSYESELSPTYGTKNLLITGKLAIDNSADIWDLSVPDPANYALDTFLVKLSKANITVNQSHIVTRKIDDLASIFGEISLLAEITSPPLEDIIKTTNQDSNNLFAESLHHTLGRIDSEVTSNAAIANILAALGIDRSNFQLEDGSGLSRHNLATPMALVQTLDVMADHAEGETYKNSLAIAGSTGTLRRRFQDSPIAGHLFGKTGTMTNIATLSGYLELPGDRTLALSILVNQSPQPASITRQGIDDIVTAAYQWGQCTSAPNNQTIQTAP
jgi:D-alanyl-D-alanine carboxypeptidase/D-alanyl-D-alanine-endopeptidase (penicillin-binding protein 4)